MATRTQLLADPRSGARPLSGSAGPGDVEDEGQAAAVEDAGQPEAAASMKRASRACLAAAKREAREGPGGAADGGGAGPAECRFAGARSATGPSRSFFFDFPVAFTPASAFSRGRERKVATL